jgi:hypothetical protein
MKTIFVEECSFVSGFNTRHEDEEFMSKIVCADEAIKLNGRVNHHNCVYWVAVNPYIHVEKWTWHVLLNFIFALQYSSFLLQFKC